MERFGPSTFTPFFRRFTDERARDLQDTVALYDRVRHLHAMSPNAAEDADYALVFSILDDLSALPDSLRTPFGVCMRMLLQQEAPLFTCPKVDFSGVLSLKEQVDLRHFLRAKEHFHTNEAKVMSLLRQGLTTMFGAIAERLPELSDPTPWTIPLVNAIPDAREFVDQLIGELWQQRYIDTGLFVEVARTVYFNLCRVSGVADPHDPKKPFRRASESEMPLQDMVVQYLGGTPFCPLFLQPVPLRFSYEDRFSHMHVVGGSGAGKTQLLQNLILHDLSADDSPSLVIVDSQGDLINKLSHLAIFHPDHGPLRDRLTLITPKDIQHPPALNIFDVKRLGTYDEATKEQVTAGVIDTFDYLFSGLLGADLTAKQGVFFKFIARLMLALPETMGRSATVLDMLALMDDAKPYAEAIARLPPIQRTFFERDFPGKTFTQTREQIRYRLNAILENPTLARLFTAEETRIDLFQTLNSGGIVLVDTAKDFLKGASAHFGRIFISLVLQAVLERAVIPEHKRRPTFLIVDEAAAYFDANIDDFLTEARKYKCGCVFAHQFLDQASHELRASLAANTSIKMAGGVSTGDARTLAPDLRTTPDFILKQLRLHFACHVRNVTPNGVSIPIPVGELERQPRLDDGAYAVLRERNRKRIGGPTPVRPSTFAMRETEVTSALNPNDRTREFRNGGSKPDPSAPSEEW